MRCHVVAEGALFALFFILPTSHNLNIYFHARQHHPARTFTLSAISTLYGHTSPLSSLLSSLSSLLSPLSVLLSPFYYLLSHNSRHPRPATPSSHKKNPHLHAGSRDFEIYYSDYAPKLSKRIFSEGTPRLSSIFTTDEAIIGGPHIR